MVISWQSWVDDHRDGGDKAGRHGRGMVSGLDLVEDGCDASLSQRVRVTFSPERRAERRMDEGFGMS